LIHILMNSQLIYTATEIKQYSKQCKAAEECPDLISREAREP